MVKIQIDLTEKQDRLVEIFKAKERIETKEQTIKKMIESFTECDHDFERLEKKRYKVPTYQALGHNIQSGDYERIVERCKKCGFVRKDDIKL